MKRFVVKLAIFLLAGAIINVAVAWAASRWDIHKPKQPRIAVAQVQSCLGLESTRAETPFTTTVTTSLFYSEQFNELVQQTPPSGGSVENDPIALLPSWGELTAASDTFKRYREQHPTLSVNEQRKVRATGWPCRSLWCEFGRFVRTPRDGYIESQGISGTFAGWFLPRERVLKAVLPVFIIWPGFAINTIFYAAVLGIVFVVPGAVRRRVRIKRGQCAACGYSLRGTSGGEKCPECGVIALGPTVTERK